MALNLPDYLDVIDHPMDLGTIAAKLDARQYASIAAYRDDVQLTFRRAPRPPVPRWRRAECCGFTTSPMPHSAARPRHCRNARVYNRPSSAAHRAAVRLEACFGQLIDEAYAPD